jgi:archaellum biogenesis ATPase FlaH
MARKEDAQDNIDYSADKQKLLIDIMLSSEEIFTRCQNIINPKYFDSKLRAPMRFILEYANKYHTLPKVEHLNAQHNLGFMIIDNITIQHQDSFLDEIEGFCKNKAIALAITDSVDLIEKGNYGEVERLVREAILISLQSDLGTDYFSDPRERLMRVRNRNGQVSTGWKTIDDKLYGGINRGELSIWCGGSGAGKSLFLQNQSLYLIKQNLNVIYITLELSEELTSMRMDSMLTEYGTKEIFRNLDAVEIKVKQAGFNSGLLHIKQMPQGSNCNDIKAYIKNYEIVTQKRPDALVVDYLDLLYPTNKLINPSDLYIKDKYVTEELRGLVVEHNTVGITASQLNRSAVAEQEHDQSMIAGGLSKIQTADNVMSIFASSAMKERGQYQIQFLKTRSSSGVGSKVYLGFDPNTLKIFDLDEEAQAAANGVANGAEVFDELRRKNNNIVKKSPVPAGASNVTTSAAKLDSLRNLIRR